MSDLISTAPYVWSALLGLIETAALAQNPVVQVFPFELGQYEPAAYVMLTGIEQHTFEWETIGSFTQKETYDICGKVTYWTGDSPADTQDVASTVITQVYSTFQTLVMTPAMSNRTVPILGNTYAAAGAVYLMLPGYARYSAAPGLMQGAQAGWEGTLAWSFHFEALVTPA